MSKKDDNKKGKKPFLFWILYSFFILVFIIGISIALNYLWDTLSDYEDTRAEYVIEAITKDVNNGEIDTLLRASNVADYKYATFESIKSQFSKVLEGKTVIYLKTFSADRVANPAYNLMIDDEVIAKVTLRLSDRKSEYGRNYYELYKVEEIHCDNYKIVRVPSCYSVKVNGIVLDETWVKESSASNIETQYMLVSQEEAAKWGENYTYVIDGFAAEADMEILMPDGTAAETYLNQYGVITTYKTQEITIKAPFNHSIFVNGVNITDSDRWQIEISDPLPEFNRLSNWLSESYTYITYKVTGLLEEPTVEIKNFMGDTMTPEYDDKSRTYTSDFTGDEEKYAELTDMTLEYGLLYAMTIAADYDKAQFLSQLLYRGPMYNDIDESLIQYYYTDHARYWFEEEQVFGLELYSDECFSCETSFVQWIAEIRTDPNFQESFKSHLRLYFLKTDGQWRLAEWELK